MAVLARRSRVNDACSRIKDESRTNRMPPEYGASEPEVALSLGMSRTPVRGTLVRLEVEGLVELVPTAVRGCYRLAQTAREESVKSSFLELGAATSVAARRARTEELTPFESGVLVPAAALTAGRHM